MLLDIFSHKGNTIQLYRSMLAPVAKQHDLTQMELDVLLFLANNPQHDTARDLVEIRHLSKSHVSTAVDALVQRCFLQRDQKPNNKKLIHLKLLPAAFPSVQQGQATQKAFFDQIFKGFTVQERKQLTRLLLRVEENASLGMALQKQD